MFIEYVIFIPFVLVAFFVIWGMIMVERSRNETWSEVMNAPAYKVVPIAPNRYEIKEKVLWPMPGLRPPMLSYCSLFGTYKTVKEAQKVIEHLSKPVKM